MPMASSQAAAGSGTGVIDSAAAKRRGRRAGQKVAAASDQVEIGEREGLGRGGRGVEDAAAVDERAGGGTD